MAATQILAEDSVNLMGVFGSKPKVEGVGLLDMKKYDGDSVTAADDSGSDGRVVLDGSLNGLVARDEKNGNGDFSCTNNMGGGGVKRWKERGRINLNVDVTGEGMGIGRWNGERLEDQDHGFRVGDFVWGKIKSHPWWPGQVHDPRDASELALKHSQEGRVLVAFFGDGSCSWCLPSQLVPFVQNLQEKSTDCSSKSFVSAVQKAVDEIGRVMESKITCKCIPLEMRGHLARPMVANVGVRAGVLVPEVDMDRLPVPEYESADILAKVTDFAKSVSVGNVLQLAILRSWISSYYAKHGSRPAVYTGPLVIEGLEDRNNEETAVKNAVVPFTAPIQGPEPDEWISSPTVSSGKSQDPSDDKIYQRRKQKSVSEIMEKKSIVKTPKTKSVDPEVEVGASQGGLSTGNGGRKRRSDGTLVVIPNAIEVAHAENTCFDSKLELESTPRERKRSKYLSPPYTNLIGRIGCSRFDEHMEVETVGRNSRSASQDLSASATTGSELDDEAEENEKKMTFPASDVDVEVHELLLKLEFAAVDCLYLRKEGYLDSIWAFISAHRSSTYVHGSDNKIYQKCKTVNHKRKSSRKPRGTSCRRPAEEPETSLPTDDLISDARVIRQKLDTMTAILENYCSRFSSDDKSCLKHEMKHLMENVETASEKVRVLAENT